jgi:hypothetical protein
LISDQGLERINRTNVFIKKTGVEFVLGEKIGEEQGKVTGRRVLKAEDPRYLKMEVSFEGQTTIFGIQGVDMGTYTVFERIAGQLYGEGQGMIMTADGDGVIWNGHGVGRMDANGTMFIAASITYQTDSYQTDSAKLSRLNGVLGVIEYQSDMQGNIRSAGYEWKA